MLEIYFSELFSNITNPKACFQARKIRLPFFSYRSLLLSTNVLNDYIAIITAILFLQNTKGGLMVDEL